MSATSAGAAEQRTATESIFVADGERFVPTVHARGPWDPRALHGGAPAALITTAFERMEPGSEMPIARLGFELLRPVPFAPLSLSTRIVRPGRRVQELAGELSCAGQPIARASALRVQEVPHDLPATPPPSTPEPDTWAGGEMPGPDGGRPVRFALDHSDTDSFAASAMEMRWLGQDPRALGPGRVWMRLRYPLLPGEELTPLARLAATADFGNGVSAVLPFDRFLFINADLTIHLQRQPRGEWIGLDARTLAPGGGTGLSESVLHDVHGAVGRAFQTLVVQPR
jgi:acyl-Coa thioesterase superfamily protein/acyl-CoA thioesterase superfamily protein